MFRTFQQDAKQVKKILEGSKGAPKVIPWDPSATYQQGRLKTVEVLGTWLEQASKGALTQTELGSNIAAYLEKIDQAMTTFRTYGFLIDPREIEAIRDYVKGQVECYRLHQARIEVLLKNARHS
jgi:hypothetical protein